MQFWRGCAKVLFFGALSPYYHKFLIKEANYWQLLLKVEQKKGRYKENCRLQEMDTDIFELAEDLNFSDLKLKSKNPISIYN